MKKIIKKEFKDTVKKVNDGMYAVYVAGPEGITIDCDSKQIELPRMKWSKKVQDETHQQLLDAIIVDFPEVDYDLFCTTYVYGGKEMSMFCEAKRKVSPEKC